MARIPISHEDEDISGFVGMYFSGRIFALQKLDLDCERSWFRSPASPFFGLFCFVLEVMVTSDVFLQVCKCALLAFWPGWSRARAEPNTRGVMRFN